MAATWQQALQPTITPLGALIRQHRLRRHLSQGALARLAGVNYSFMSRLESGGRLAGVETLHAIADALMLSDVERVVLLAAGGCIENPIDELRATLLIDYWNLREG